MPLLGRHRRRLALPAARMRHPAQRSATSILAHAARVHGSCSPVRLLLVHLKAVGHARPGPAQAAPAGRWTASNMGGPSPACLYARLLLIYTQSPLSPFLPTAATLAIPPSLRCGPSFECRYRFSTGLLAGGRPRGAAAGQGWGPGRCASETQTSCAAMGAMPPQAQQQAQQEAATPKGNTWRLGKQCAEKQPEGRQLWRPHAPSRS